jgi:hypothetical protein
VAPVLAVATRSSLISMKWNQGHEYLLSQLVEWKHWLRAPRSQAAAQLPGWCGLGVVELAESDLG